MVENEVGKIHWSKSNLINQTEADEKILIIYKRNLYYTNKKRYLSKKFWEYTASLYNII